ncbi:MAG: Spy/CpxP family protein refolding chaperone [Duncaniella sp.]|uniref:Spy/CpxP family protein refolding chaperone n=1 Tax=Duncaniella sp. TaxID=2518496 RepID=UPI0019A514BC|nr:Spy/CpxP family protein refolding chaperone [Duncaniella sp.]MBD5312839.1 hypothetical protein [Bacteroides sp.]MBD5334917.1 hypothetical protein [Bacteroides sp.]MDE6089599.1 Spy/CpxP family protein refolding chaperone [Duncaniella sp.]
MKRIALSLILVLSAILLPFSAQAQRPSGREREAWMKEMQQFKNDFITKKLALTDEQKAKFIPLYNSMDEEIRKTQAETEKLYRNTSKKDSKVTDLEYEKAAEALYELKGRENDIEMKYFKEFKQILTPKQLFQLKDAERDFTRQLMKQHRTQRKTK